MSIKTIVEIPGQLILCPPPHRNDLLFRSLSSIFFNHPISTKTPLDMSEIPKTFKAWQYATSGRPEQVLKLVDNCSLPVIAGFPIIVKVKAAALNPVGYKVMSEMPSLAVKHPGVPEQDYAGTVAGGDLTGTDLKIGDEVFGTIPVR